MADYLLKHIILFLSCFKLFLGKQDKMFYIYLYYFVYFSSVCIVSHFFYTFLILK
jgi:hypothetical protein